MNIYPIRDNVIILPHKAPEESKGGIVLPDYVKKRKDTGTVLAVGSEVKDIKVGDIVLHGEFCGISYAKREIIDGKEMFIMREENIIAKITERSNEKKSKRSNKRNG